MAETAKIVKDQIREFVRCLAKLSEQIDPTDLGELAQIHENSQKIIEVIKEESEPVFAQIRMFCEKSAQTAENLILESIDKPAEALKNLSLAIRDLHECMEITEEIPTPADMEKFIATLPGGVEVSQEAAKPAETKEAAVAEQPKQEASAPTMMVTEDFPEHQSEPLFIAAQEIEYAQSFYTECKEHIENIESGVLELERTPGDLDKINELFRPFHTIKGMAGFLNLKDIQALTHEVETLLDLGRKGKLQVTPPIIDLIFETLDVLKVQLNSIGQYLAQPNDQQIPQPPINEIIRRIHFAAQGTMIPAVMPVSDKPGGKKPIGEILTENGSVAPAVVEFALQQQKAGDNKPVGNILTSMGAVSARDVSKALRQQNNTEVQDTVVRVDTVKLDSLVNLVGELVIIQTQVEQNPVSKQSPQLLRLIEQVSKITRDVQEVAMSMRMVPLTQTFHKMGRVVRDLSHKINKKIDFQIEGEDTELDKNVIQELSDPLMHMIRNAVDHGIESAEKRLAAGKPEAGMVKLKAYHQAGNIVIEISDDGKGLDKDVLIRKAIEKGLISPDTQLSEAQAFNLIMGAGFSTAEKVTDISGRGVGMDVVKKNIEKLRGKVEIHSVLGEGTMFTIKLPLTLAVIDGMIVRVGSQKFVVPTLSIVQALSPTAEQIKTIQDREHILNLRGELYTLVSLCEMFGIRDGIKDPTKAMVLIAQAEDRQVGLVLDELLGQQQVVIKSLGERFKSITGITGGAILGDGTIGLILEPAGLLEVHQRALVS
jgi:two-component system chemotaxis sensor kinase CheA